MASKESMIKSLEAALEAAKQDNDDYECVLFWSEDGEHIKGQAHASIGVRISIHKALKDDLDEHLEERGIEIVGANA